MLVGLALTCGALTVPPPGLNEFVRSSERVGTLATIRRSAAAAVGRALANGIELVEVEFPPLIETKSQFDDFSNVEELDANRDFGVQLALEPEIASFAPGEKLWLCFADDGEAKLAREAWPGKRYAEATQTSIAGAIGMVGLKALRPLGSSAADAAGSLAAMLGLASKPPPPPAPAPPAALHLVVQPGNGGPMEDWLNLEILRHPGTPMVCLNGALDKVTSGYYSDLLNPKLGECAARFFSQCALLVSCSSLAPKRSVSPVLAWPVPPIPGSKGTISLNSRVCCCPFFALEPPLNAQGRSCSQRSCSQRSCLQRSCSQRSCSQRSCLQRSCSQRALVHR
jgi:hypothetical protein